MGRLRDFIVCFFAIFSHSLVEGKCKQNVSGRERLILEQHNELRKRHKDTPDMCYGESDSTHTYTSGEWADKMLIVARNKGQIEHSKNEGTGENMAWSWGSRLSAPETLIVDSTHRWYNEIVGWDLANAKKKSGVVGHFTQLVWRSTEEVMCQHAAGPSNFFYVCQYYPPGNYNSPSSLKQNVLPLKSGVEYDGYKQMKDEFQERVQNGDFENGKDNENEKKKKNEKDKKDKKEEEKEKEKERKEKEKADEEEKEERKEEERKEKERRDKEKSDEEEKENREEEEENKENGEKYEEHEDRRTGLDESKKKKKENEEHEERRTGLDENKKKNETEEEDQEDDDVETSTENIDDYERYDGGRRQSKKGGITKGYPIISLVVKIAMLCVIMVLLVVIYRKN